MLIVDYAISHADPNDPESMNRHVASVNQLLTRLTRDGRHITDVQDTVTATSKRSVLFVTRVMYLPEKPEVSR